MYQLSTVDIDLLKKVKVRNQDKIRELTGRELVPQKAFEIIKNETKSFSQDNEKAKIADALMVKLLQREGLKNSETSDSQKKRLELEAQAKAKALELLELELKLAA